MHKYDLRAAILDRAAALKAVAHHTKISPNHRLEALSAGYANTKFASVAAVYGDGVPHLDMFDQGRMAHRMVELSDQPSADIVELQADGVSVQVNIVKDLVQPQRFSDVSYRVDVHVDGLGALDQQPIFLVPQKLLPNGHEPFRLDSAHDRRVDSGVDAPVGLSGQLLEAKLVDGHWHGGLHIYDADMKDNDTGCLSWVRHSLTHAIHRCLVPIVRCDVYRPIRPVSAIDYLQGVWCVRLRVHPDVAIPNTTFNLPALPYHNIPMLYSDLADVGVGLLRHGLWTGEVYPNGQEGLDHPLTAHQVQSAFLRAIESVVKPYVAATSSPIKYRPTLQFASAGESL